MSKDLDARADFKSENMSDIYTIKTGLFDNSKRF